MLVAFDQERVLQAQYFDLARIQSGLTTCKSQAVIALSSGEAEYYGLVSGLCQGLGEQSTLHDWGITIPMIGFMDATTGLAIGSRHGLGKVKHIDTVFLWAQEVVTSGRAKLYKKPTVDMLADLFTKPLEAQRMLMLLSRMGYSFVEGRHHLALDIWGAWANTWWEEN